jgi:hypothetical protein
VHFVTASMRAFGWIGVVPGGGGLDGERSDASSSSIASRPVLVYTGRIVYIVWYNIRCRVPCYELNWIIYRMEFWTRIMVYIWWIRLTMYDICVGSIYMSVTMCGLA